MHEISVETQPWAITLGGCFSYFRHGGRADEACEAQAAERWGNRASLGKDLPFSVIDESL